MKRWLFWEIISQFADVSTSFVRLSTEKCYCRCRSRRSSITGMLLFLSYLLPAESRCLLQLVWSYVWDHGEGEKL